MPIVEPLPRNDCADEIVMMNHLDGVITRHHCPICDHLILLVDEIESIGVCSNCAYEFKMERKSFS